MTRFATVMVTYLASLGTIASVVVPVTPRLVWNASASAPIGLYRIDPDARPSVGDLVAIRPPDALAAFLAERGYVGRGALLLKPIGAVTDQRVCRIGLSVSVDSAVVAEARERDRLGRNLPNWQGCVRLGESDVFLLNPAVPDSLDGRYFGPIDVDAVVGRATPIWLLNSRAHTAGTISEPPPTP